MSQRESAAIASEVEPSPSASSQPRPTTRRNFIVWYLAGLLTATVVAIVAPLIVFFYPPAGQGKKQDLTVTLDQSLDGLANGNAVKFESPKDTGFVMTDGGGDNAPGKIAFGGFAVKDQAGNVAVFAMNCSHLGCSIAFDAAAALFKCPCHGSQFHSDGTVAHGPAAFPLSHLAWRPGPSSTQITVGGLSLPGIG